MITFRRRFLRLASGALALAALTFYLVHTGPVQRFVLGQIESYLRQGQGLMLRAENFDYNLLSSKFELKEATLKFLPSEQGGITARRLVVQIPLWELVLGSFETAQVQIDGLAVTWIAAGNGPSNWPSAGTHTYRLPAISAVNCDINWQDARSGASIHLPNGRFSLVWNSARNQHDITFSSSSGYSQWNQARLPLDQVQLRSALTSSGFSLSSLRLASGSSNAEISGTFAGSSARIEASGTLNADLHELSDPLGLSKPVQGRVKAELSATGSPNNAQIKGTLSTDRLVTRGTSITDAAAAALFDTATGQLQITRISAGVFSGQLTGSGNIHTAKDQTPSEFAATLAGVDPRQVARAMGSVIAYTSRTSVEVRANWPGLEWRRASLVGSARSLSARLNFRAACGPQSIRTSLQAALGDAAAASGDITLTLPNQALSGNLTGDISSIDSFTRDVRQFMPDTSSVPPRIDGTMRWSATLGGTLPVPSASVQTTGNEISIGSLKNADVAVDANLSAGAVEIQRARLQWSGQKFEMNGRLDGLTADSPLRLEGTVEGDSIGTVFENLGVARLAEASFSGTVHVAGKVGNPAVETTLNLGDFTLFGQRFARTVVDAQWRNSQLHLTRFQAEQDAETPTPGRVEANGSLDIGARQYALKLMGQGLRPTFNGNTLVTGTFGIEAQGTGTLDNPAFNARVSGSDVRIGEAIVGELLGEAEARDHRGSGVLTAPALNARLGWTLGMERDWPFEFNLNAENTRLKTTPASSFDANVSGSGSLVTGGLARINAVVRNLRLETPGQDTTAPEPIRISYADRQLRVEQLSLVSGDSNLGVTGAIPMQDGATPGSLALQGRVALDRLAGWIPEMNGSYVRGVAEVNAVLNVSGRQWTPTGSITILDGGFKWPSFLLPIENVSGRFDIADAILRTEQISGALGTGKLTIAGSLPLRLISTAFPVPTADAGQPARVSGKLDDLRFTTRKDDKEATATFGVKLAAQASSLNLDAVQGSLEFSELRLQSADTDFRQTTPTRITIAAGVARLESLSAKGPNGSLAASGAIDLKGKQPIQLDATADLTLGGLAALVDPLETDGHLRMEAHVRGTLAEPRTTGFLTLKDAAVGWPDPQLQGTEVNLKATFVDDEIRISELSGKLNGGSLTGGGDLKITRGQVVSSTLQVRAADVFLEYPAGVKTTSVLDLKLALRDNRPLVQGSVEIQDGFWDAPFETFGSRQALSQTGPGAQARPANSPLLDVRIVTKRAVEMDNNLGRFGAAANLRLAGTVAQPRVVGNLELEQDGRIYFGDRTYYIERGTIRFLDAPRLTPELDIHASTRAGSYTVNLGLTGQPNELTTTFSSDPPLPREDVIAVLLTGKTVAENPGVDIRSLEGYALASGALSASLSNRLHRFGVSRVSIQPSAVAAESNPGARITFTQDFTTTFRLLYSMNLSDSNDQIWITEYDLSRRFTTRAVKQSDNTYRGEFRHDVRFGSSSLRKSVAVRPPLPEVSRVDFIGVGSFTRAELAKRFKIKLGQRPNAAKLRSGSEKLVRFLAEKGHLESRVRVDRDEDGQKLSLTVRVELGPKVEMAFEGAGLSGKQKARVRGVWHAGISKQQRLDAAKNSILDHLADKGYLRAELTSEVLLKEDRELVRFQIRPGIQFRDVKIEIQGAEAGRARDVVSFLERSPLRVSVYRDSRRASAVVRRYYEERGYLAARMEAPVFELNEQRQTGQIVVPIAEGPLFRVGTLEFNGNTALTSKDLRQGLPLEMGSAFEPARLDAVSGVLKHKYGQLGYGDADFDYEIARHEESAALDISFNVIENHRTTIGAVNVEGNRRTSADFARSRMLITPGEVANTDLIRESARNLAQTGAYASADVQLQPLEESLTGGKRVQVANLLVSVAEPKPFRLLYGGLYDSGGGPGFISDLQNHNSLGPGRILGLRLRSDPDTSEARLYVTRPFWRHHRLSTTIATYYTRRTEYYQTTPTERLGISIQQDLPLRSKWILSYGYRFEKQRGFVPDPSAPEVTADVVNVAPASFTISREARDSFLDATRGSFLSHGFQYAPGFLGSDYPYARYYLQYFKYFPLTRPRPVLYGDQPERSRFVFASGWRLGVQKGFSEEGAVLTDRFYAGGGTTVRGFGQDQLGPKLDNGDPAGGNAVVVLNNELRFPLFWVFDGVAFVDVGNVFPRASDLNFSDLRGAGGFGLRIRNPFVVLRFDYGVKFERLPGEKAGAFFFSIGQAF